MTLTLTCENCGRPFTAKRKDTRWCGGNCRFAAREKTRAPIIHPIAPPSETEDHSRCKIHPHEHTGDRALCSGRFRCETHQTWFNSSACPGCHVPALR